MALKVACAYQYGLEETGEGASAIYPLDWCWAEVFYDWRAIACYVADDLHSAPKRRCLELMLLDLAYPSDRVAVDFVGVDEDSNYCVEGHDCSNWLLLLHSQGNGSLALGFLKDNRLLQWEDAFQSIHMLQIEVDCKKN